MDGFVLSAVEEPWPYSKGGPKLPLMRTLPWESLAEPQRTFQWSPVHAGGLVRC